MALCQFETGSGVLPGEKRRLRDMGPDFIAFPEYFFAPSSVGTQGELAARSAACLGFLAGLSEETGAAVVGGTVVESLHGELHNVCPLFDSGREIARYSKRHPTERERAAGIVAGRGPVVAEARGVRVALLICADVLKPESFDESGRLGAKIVFAPVVSPLRAGDTQQTKEGRDRSIFQDGAKRSGAFVVKTAAPGSVFGGPLQARSLVAAPWGILARVGPDQEGMRLILTADLDLDALPPPAVASSSSSV